MLVIKIGARRTELLKGWAEAHGDRVLVVPLDVTDATQVDEPIQETIADYRPMLEAIRAGMVEQDGKQLGDPERGVRAVIAAMSQQRPPRRLVLGSAGFDAVTATLQDALADIRASETLSRGADFPTAA